MSSCPFSTSVALLWALSQVFISFWYCEAQNHTHYLRWGFTNAEYSGTITLDQLATSSSNALQVYSWSFWLHIVDSDWVYNQSKASDLLLQGCTPASHSLTYLCINFSPLFKCARKDRVVKTTGVLLSVWNTQERSLMLSTILPRATSEMV